MRRLLVILSLALPLAACADATGPKDNGAQATKEAAPETAASLVKKHLAAAGGEARLRAAKTMMFTAAGVEGEVEKLTVHQARPNQFRKEFTKGGKTFVKVFDGAAGFTVEDSKVTAIPDAKLADMKAHADFDDAILDHEAKGHKVELLGTEDVRGAKTYKLRLTLKGGSVEHRYLDASTHLEVKRVNSWEHEGKKQEKTTYFSDYRSVDGIQVNHVIETEMDGKKTRLVIKEAWYDRAIDPALFRKPEA
jgi:hypothetical protein